jgi:tRNA uridine 5-carbamoylmethylation protein Kti12
MTTTPTAATDASSAPTLIAFRGLPGSGKTTAALELFAADAAGMITRCNRDQLRRHHFGRPLYDADSEAVITVLQNDAITVLLRTGRSVIVDDTNLADDRLANLRLIAGVCGAQFEIRDLRDVPLDTCIARDEARPEDEQVGEKVIRRMYDRYIAPLSTQEAP